MSDEGFFSVLYFSIHRYEDGKFWPSLRDGNFNCIGTGQGSGYNINVPLNTTGCGDAEYMAIVTNILLPIAYEVIFINLCTYLFGENALF